MKSVKISSLLIEVFILQTRLQCTPLILSLKLFNLFQVCTGDGCFYISMSPFSCQIEARQIDFWRLSQVEIRRIEIYHFYPPRFIVAVNGRKAMTDSHAEISFTGIQPSVQEELPLLIPRGSLMCIHFHTYHVPIFEDLLDMQPNLTHISAHCSGF